MTMTRRSAFGFVAGAPAFAAGFEGLVRAQGAARSGEGRKGLKLAARSKLVMVGEHTTRPASTGTAFTPTMSGAWCWPVRSWT
jgi:hypothetical protein